MFSTRLPEQKSRESIDNLKATGGFVSGHLEHGEGGGLPLQNEQHSADQKCHFTFLVRTISAVFKTFHFLHFSFHIFRNDFCLMFGARTGPRGGMNKTRVEFIAKVKRGSVWGYVREVERVREREREIDTTVVGPARKEKLIGKRGKRRNR